MVHDYVTENGFSYEPQIPTTDWTQCPKLRTMKLWKRREVVLVQPSIRDLSDDLTKFDPQCYILYACTKAK